jgi:hypothetical protein
VDEARRYIDAVGGQKGLGPDSVEPSVTVEVTKPEDLALHVRFPAPTSLRGQVEQDILRHFLASHPPSSTAAGE